MAGNKWKDFLLKSGLPLEYEVKELLDKRKCISSFEYSYLRSDENKIINEFFLNFFLSTHRINRNIIQFIKVTIYKELLAKKLVLENLVLSKLYHSILLFLIYEFF